MSICTYGLLRFESNGESQTRNMIDFIWLVNSKVFEDEQGFRRKRDISIVIIQDRSVYYVSLFTMFKKGGNVDYINPLVNLFSPLICMLNKEGWKILNLRNHLIETDVPSWYIRKMY